MSKAKVNLACDKPLPLRVRVFSKWVTIKLRTKGITVHNILKQIKSGVILVNLAEVLTGNIKHKAWTRNPTKPFQCIENIDLALCLFKNDGVKFHYQIVNPQEIYTGNIKSINSLVWSLIMKYTIEPIVFSKNENNIINNQNSNDSVVSNHKNRFSNDNKEDNNENNCIKDNKEINSNKSCQNDNQYNKGDDYNKEGKNEKKIRTDECNEKDDNNEGNNENKSEAANNKNTDENNEIFETQRLFKNKKHLALLLLLKWCTDHTNNYEGIDSCRPVHLALSALLNNFRPDVINYKKNYIIKNDRSIAISVIKAMKALKIHILIEIEDLLNPIDDRSFFTQVALIKEVLQPNSDTNIDDVCELKKQLLSFENGDSSSGIGKSASLCSLNAYNEYDDDEDENNEKNREPINLKDVDNRSNYSSSAFSSGSGTDTFSFSNYEKPKSHRPFMLLMTMATTLE